MTVDDMKDAKAVSELFDDLAIDAEAITILLDLVSESQSVPDKLSIAISSIGAMVDALSDRAQAYAELMRDRAKLDEIERSATATDDGPSGGTVIPFS